MKNCGFIAEDTEVKCPNCDSEVVYRYGRAWTGKQRFLCLICKKQFTVGRERVTVKDRPCCPACGKVMHIYKREETSVRFRCASYPKCRIFINVKTQKEE